MLKKYLATTIICWLAVLTIHSPSAYSEFMGGIPKQILSKTADQQLPTLSNIEKKTTEINQQISKATQQETIQQLNNWLQLLELQTAVIKKTNALEDNLLNLPSVSIAATDNISITQYDDLLDHLQQQEATLQAAKEQLNALSISIKNRLNDYNTTLHQDTLAIKQTNNQGQLNDALLKQYIAFEQLSLARLEYQQQKETLNFLQKKFGNINKKSLQLVQQVTFNYQDLQFILQRLKQREQQLHLQQKEQKQQYKKSQALWQAQQSVLNQNASALETQTLHKQLLSQQQQLDLTAKELSRLPAIYDAWELRYALFQPTTTTNNKTKINVLKEQLSTYNTALNNIYTTYDNLIIEKSSLVKTLNDTQTPSLQKNLIEQQRDISELLSNTVFDYIQQLKQDKKILERIYNEALQKNDQQNFSGYASSSFKSLYGVWDTQLFTIEDRSITLGKFITGFLLLISGVWISKALSRLIGRVLRHRFELNEGIASIVESLSFYVLLATVILFALNLINIPLTIFTMVGGALAIGIGLGSQTLMNNFISGLVLLAERPVRVGDFIQLEQLKGVVTYIGARSTHIKTPENINVIVPNSSLLQERVTNWTDNDGRVRTSIIIAVAYGSSPRDVAKLLKKAAERHGNVLKNPKPIVLFTDFASGTLNFELIVWITIQKLIERSIIESDLRFQVDQLFKEAGIEIAITQQNIHFDSKTPLTVQMSKEPQEPIE